MIASRLTIGALVVSLVLSLAATPALASDILRARAMGDDTPQAQPAPEERTEKPFKRKKVLLAFLMSTLIPSSGQFYNGETQKGVLMVALLVSGVVIHTMTTSSEDKTSLGDPGAIIVVATWGWSIFDAPISALRINQQHEQNTQIPAALLPQKGWDMYGSVSSRFDAARAGVQLRF